MGILKSAASEIREAPLYYLGVGLSVACAVWFVFCFCFPLGWDVAPDYLRWRAGLTHTYADGKTCAELGGKEVMVCDRTNYTAYGVVTPNFMGGWNGS